jgi:hypothetical protein
MHHDSSMNATEPTTETTSILFVRPLCFDDLVKRNNLRRAQLTMKLLQDRSQPLKRFESLWGEPQRDSALALR